MPELHTFFFLLKPNKLLISVSGRRRAGNVKIPTLSVVGMMVHWVWRTISTTGLWKLFENKEVMEVGEALSRTPSPLISPSLFNQVPAGLPTPPAFLH